MARIPVSRSAITTIGKAFGEAANDPQKREAFRADPVGYLKASGIAQESLDGVNVVLHEDDESTLHFVLPAKVDAERLNARDREYLHTLGTAAVLGCCRPLR